MVGATHGRARPMEYRKLGRTGLDAGAIGLGTEHLENTRGTIEKIIHTAVDAGLNYIDLLSSDPQRDALFWDNFGPVFRAHRDQLILAARWGDPVRYPDLDYCRRCFEGILTQVGNGHVEVGMLLMVDSETKWKEWGRRSVEYLLRYREEGRIGAIGMSSHRAPVSIKAANSGLIDVLLYPLYLTPRVPEDVRALLEACADQGVGLVAMKPYGGGVLLRPQDGNRSPTPVQCLHYVLSLPVSGTVPGVRNADELRAALHYWEATDEEKDYGSVISHVHPDLMGQCTYCNHCLPCPQQIAIGHTLYLVQEVPWTLFDELVAEYAALEVKASECTECGVCMERCPFEVDVIAKMRKAVELYEAGPAWRRPQG